MKERPILFKGEMVRAILEESKTQTRRVADIIWDTSKHWGNYDCWTFQKRGKPLIGFSTRNGGQNTLLGHCPYGQPGDRLWVKETHLPTASGVYYRADFSDFDAAGHGAMYGGWKPSIFCKRTYSRITLEIVSVRVERLNDITEKDAKAEGINVHAGSDAVCEYAALWNKINGAGSWALNPWVWVVEFRRI